MQDQSDQTMSYPQIIQGGMGVAVSGWKLARAVSAAGQLGVVSGTAVDLVLARRLQVGDLEGKMRFALDHFPIPAMAQRIWDRYYLKGGKADDAPHKSKPVPALKPTEAYTELTVVANFVEVFLAKHGGNGPIGINLLEKIQLPTLPSLFGAMLAGVDYVLMGAGIPRHIPAALDKLAILETATLPVDVVGAEPGEEFHAIFDPKGYTPEGVTSLKRPNFLAIVSSAPLATMLAKKCTGRVDGFVIEGPTAGGHNAPPRGQLTLTDEGEPIYGARDVPDLAAFRALGLPFWMAGSYGSADGLESALKEGAAGVQLGTAFAFCEESGIAPHLKERVLRQALAKNLEVFTDPLASPTGFPFKVVKLEGTQADPEAYAKRERICDLGYLRTMYKTEKGTIGYRCASEPIEDFLKKGGELTETVGRKCICNGLLATINLEQVRKGVHEMPMVTAGDYVKDLADFVTPGALSYTALDVINKILRK